MQTMGERVVVCARGFLGTRFHHQGRLKRTQSHLGGIDCLGLLVEVARELDLRGMDGGPLAALDRTDYGHYPDTAALVLGLGRALMPVDKASLRPGDIALFTIEGQAQHMGIISATRAENAMKDTASFGLIHAYAPARAVVEHALDAWWRARMAALFRLAP